MKPRLYILIFFIISNYAILAQTPVISLTGGSCAGTTLSLSSSLNLSFIVWKLNGVTIDTTFATWNRRGTTVAGSTSGISGSTSSLLNFPFGLFVDTHDTLYIADYLNNRIQKWAPGTVSGTTIAGTGTAGNSDSEIDNPANVFLDTSKNIFVTDYLNNRIQKFSHGSIHATTVAGNHTGRGGGNDSLLDLPTSIYVDNKDTIFVCDGNNSRIMKWGRGADTGILVAGGHFGSSASDLSVPLGIYMDTNRNLYIADTYNNRIQQWRLGMSSGLAIAGGTFGSSLSEFSNPSGVYVDGNNTVYVADAGNNRIIKWIIGGSSGVNIAGSITCDTGSVDSMLNNPANVFLDPNGNLFVADASNNRVQKFSNSISITHIADSAGTYSATGFTYKGGMATDSIFIYPNDTPTVKINTSHGDTACRGLPVVFTTTLTHTGITPSYQWEKNSLPVGTNNAIYTADSVQNGDTIVCLISTSNPCAITPNAISNKILMIVSPDTTPKITIYGNSSGPIGSTIHLFATIISATNGYKINWSNNGIIFATTTSSYVSYTKTNQTDSITATLIPTTGCYNSVVSNNWFVQVGLNVLLINNFLNDVIAYPNPCTNEINITNLKSSDIISIKDIFGRNINLNLKVNNGNPFDVHLLLPGTYILSVIDSNNNIRTNLLIQKRE